MDPCPRQGLPAWVHDQALNFATLFHGNAKGAERGGLAFTKAENWAFGGGEAFRLGDEPIAGGELSYAIKRERKGTILSGIPLKNRF